MFRNETLHHCCYASTVNRIILHMSASLPTTYAWPVSSMDDESDSFLDLLRLQAGLLWDTDPNDLSRWEQKEII